MTQLDSTARRDHRESVLLTASLLAEEAVAPTKHRVRNLSRSGVCVDCRDELPKGATFQVTIGIETLSAVVAWFRHGQVGLRFARDIDLVAARQKPRETEVAAQGGWMSHMSDPYRREAR